MSTTEQPPVAGETRDEGLTMSVNGGPAVPVSALEAIAGRREQLTLFEGQAYPDAKLVFGGGVAGFTIDLADYTDLRVGEDFKALVEGVVVAKKHGVKVSEDGVHERTLVVTLKVDTVQIPG